MKETIKKIFPRYWLDLALRFITATFAFYYTKRYGLTLRKNTTDLFVFQDIFVLRNYNLPASVKPKFIIDAGAYVGISTIFFAIKYPHAKIIAIEPEVSNFEMLKMNTRNFPNIESIRAGLWYKDSFLKIVDRHTGHWGFTTIEVDQEKDCDIIGISIDTLLERYDFAKIDILKIDIEGAEKELFSHNFESWLGMVDVIMIELHDRIKNDCSKAFYSAVSRYNWESVENGEHITLIKDNSKVNLR